jgi:hypothetical protein
MNDENSGYRLHSARREEPAASPVLPIALVCVALTIVLIAVFGVRDRDPAPEPTPSPIPTASHSPTATPTATAPAEFVKQQSGWVEAEVVMPPSPTPTMPPLAAGPTRAPRPTPRISECVAYRYSTLQVFSPSAQVKIDLRIDNRCPYDLGPGNLLFEITGWRDGGRVQSVRGVPFETIRRGRSGDLSIGLPGSLDWYDEIEVVVFD